MKNIQNILSLFKNEGFREKRLVFGGSAGGPEASSESPKLTPADIKTHLDYELYNNKETSFKDHMTNLPIKLVFNDDSKITEVDGESLKIKFAGYNPSPDKCTVPEFKIDTKDGKVTKISAGIYSNGTGFEFNFDTPLDISNPKDKEFIASRIKNEYGRMREQNTIYTGTAKSLSDLSIKLSEELKPSNIFDSTENFLDTYVTSLSNYTEIRDILRGEDFKLDEKTIRERLGDLIDEHQAYAIKGSVDLDDILKLSGVLDTIKPINSIEGQSDKKFNLAKLEDKGDFLKYYKWLISEKFHGKYTEPNFKLELKEEWDKIKRIADQCKQILELLNTSKVEKKSNITMAQERSSSENEADAIGLSIIDDVYTRTGSKVYTDSEGNFFDSNGKKVTEAKILEDARKGLKDKVSTSQENAKEKANERKNLEEIITKLENTPGLEESSLSLEGTKIKITWKNGRPNFPNFHIINEDGNLKLESTGYGNLFTEKKKLCETIKLDEELGNVTHLLIKARQDMEEKYDRHRHDIGEIDSLNNRYEQVMDSKYELQESVQRGFKDKIGRSDTDHPWENNFLNLDRHEDILQACREIGIRESKVPEFIGLLVNNWSNKSMKFRDFMLFLDEIKPEKFLESDNKYAFLTRKGEFERKFEIMQGEALRVQNNHPHDENYSETELKTLQEFDKMLKVLDAGARILEALQGSSYSVERNQGFTDSNKENIDNMEQTEFNEKDNLSGKYYNIDRIEAYHLEDNASHRGEARVSLEKTQWDPKSALFEKGSGSTAVGVSKASYEEVKKGYNEYKKAHPEAPEFKADSEPYILRMVLRAYYNSKQTMLDSGHIIKIESKKLVLNSIPKLSEANFRDLYESYAVTGQAGIIDSIDTRLHAEEKARKKAMRENLAEGTKEWYKQTMEHMITDSAEKYNKFFSWVVGTEDADNMTVTRQNQQRINYQNAPEHPKAIVDKIFDRDSEITNGEKVDEAKLIEYINRIGQKGRDFGLLARDKNWKDYVLGGFAEMIDGSTAKLKWKDIKSLKDLGEPPSQMLAFLEGLRIEREGTRESQEQEMVELMEFESPALSKYLLALYSTSADGKAEALKLAKILKKPENEGKMKEFSAKTDQLNEALKKYQEELDSAKTEEEAIAARTRFLGGFGLGFKNGKLEGGGIMYNMELDGEYSIQLGLGIDRQGHVGPCLGFSKSFNGYASVGGGLTADLNGNVFLGTPVSMNLTKIIENNTGGFGEGLGKAQRFVGLDQLTLFAAPGIDLVTLAKTGKVQLGLAAGGALSVNRDGRVRDKLKTEMDKLEGSWTDFHKETLGKQLEEKASIKDAENIKKFFNEHKEITNGNDISLLSDAQVVGLYNYLKGQCKLVAQEKVSGSILKIDKLPVIGTIFSVCQLKGAAFGAAWQDVLRGKANPAYLFGAVIGIAGRTVNIYDTEEGEIIAEEIADQQILKAILEFQTQATSVVDTGKLLVDSKTGELKIMTQSTSSDTQEKKVLYFDSNGDIRYDIPKQSEEQNYKKAMYYQVDTTERKNVKVYVDVSAQELIKKTGVYVTQGGTIIIPGNTEGLIIASKTFRQYAQMSRGTGTAEQMIVITTRGNEDFDASAIRENSNKAAEMHWQETKMSKMRVIEGAETHSVRKVLLQQWEKLNLEQTGSIFTAEEYSGVSEKEEELGEELSKEIPGIKTFEETETGKTAWSTEVAEKIWKGMKEKLKAGKPEITDYTGIISATNSVLTKAGLSPLSEKAEQQLYPYLNDRYYTEVYKKLNKQGVLAQFDKHQDATRQGFITKFEEAKNALKLSCDVTSMVNTMFAENKTKFSEMLAKVEASKKPGQTFGEAYVEYAKTNFAKIENSIIGVGTTIRATQDPRVSVFPTAELSEGTFQNSNLSSLAQKQEISKENKDLRAIIFYLTYGKSPEMGNSESFKSPLAIRMAKFSKAVMAEIGGATKYQKLVEFYKRGCKDVNDSNKEIIENFVKLVKEVEKAVLSGNSEVKLKGGYKIKISAEIWQGSYAKCGNPSIGMSQFTMELVDSQDIIIGSDVDVIPTAESSTNDAAIAATASVENEKEPKNPPEKHKGKQDEEGSKHDTNDPEVEADDADHSHAATMEGEGVVDIGGGDLDAVEASVDGTLGPKTEGVH